MKTFNLFIVIILAMFLISCRSITRQENKSNETHSESIMEKKTEFRDTIFHTPKVVSGLKVPKSALLKNDFQKELKDFENPFKPQVFSQKNGNATARLRVEKDTILVEAECDSLAIKAQIRKDFERKYLNYISEKTTEKEEKSKGIFEEITFWIVLFITGLGMGIFTCIIITHKYKN